jgi:uncharacterized membrane protein YtjA (UPF0391 family)
MLWLIILLVIWAILAVLGFTVKALLWLGIVGIILFVITLIVGIVRRSRSMKQ